MRIMPRQRKFRQPRLAPHGPELVTRREAVRLVERAEEHLDLVGAVLLLVDRRGARRADVTLVVGVEPVWRGRTGDDERVDGVDGEGVEERARFPAAIEAMADADAVGRTAEREADGAAIAAAGEALGHALRYSRCTAASRASASIVPS